MKKLKLGIILLALSMVLVSCGGTPEEKVANYIEKALTLPEMEELEKTLAATGLELDLIAEGTSVVYKYKFTINLDDMGGAEFMKEQLEAGFANEELIQESLNEIQTECKEATSVKIEYYDMDGNLLAATEIK